MWPVAAGKEEEDEYKSQEGRVKGGERLRSTKSQYNQPWGVTEGSRHV